MTDHTRTDSELVAAHLAGDTGAFAILYGRYHKFVRCGIWQRLKKVGSKTEVEDICQECWLGILSWLDSYDQSMEMKPWLATCARQSVLRYLRRKGGLIRKGRRKDVKEPKCVSIKHLENMLGAGSPLNQLLKDERNQIIRDAIEDLPERYRQLTMDIDLGGVGRAEYAKRHGMVTNTVNTRVQKAHRILKGKTRVEEYLRP